MENQFGVAERKIMYRQMDELGTELRRSRTREEAIWKRDKTRNMQCGLMAKRLIDIEKLLRAESTDSEENDKTKTQLSEHICQLKEDLAVLQEGGSASAGNKTRSFERDVSKPMSGQESESLPGSKPSTPRNNRSILNQGPRNSSPLASRLGMEQGTHVGIQTESHPSECICAKDVSTACTSSTVDTHRRATAGGVGKPMADRGLQINEINPTVIPASSSSMKKIKQQQDDDCLLSERLGDKACAPDEYTRSPELTGVNTACNMSSPECTTGSTEERSGVMVVGGDPSDPSDPGTVGQKGEERGQENSSASIIPNTKNPAWGGTLALATESILLEETNESQPAEEEEAPEEWIGLNARLWKDKTHCEVCLSRFFFTRQHHCRKCARCVCSTCSPFRLPLPMTNGGETRRPSLIQSIVQVNASNGTSPLEDREVSSVVPPAKAYRVCSLCT